MPFPTVCLNDKQHRPNEWPTFRFVQNTKGSQTVILHDSAGVPLQLDKERHKVFLLAISRKTAAQELFCVEGEILNGDAGEVEFSVTSCETLERGLFLASIYVNDTQEAPTDCDPEDTSGSSEGSDSEGSGTITYEVGNRIRSYRAYVEIEQDWTSLSERTIGITIAEVRLAMRDLSSEDNFLLDDVEFTDTEIAWAMRRPVDQWNETPPYLIGSSNYNPSNFPYRFYWVNAVKGELMRIAASNYRRNHLQYQAAGLAVDDKKKFVEYEKVGQQLKDEWNDWVMRTKRSLNFTRCFSQIELRSYGNYPYSGGGGVNR